MGILDRIKRNQYDGFKEFVQNMETTGAAARQNILISGILEDPIFMSHVMKNMRTFDDFLNLPSDEIEKVLLTQDQLVGVFAKCLLGMAEDQIKSIITALPRFTSKIKDEITYLKEVSVAERDGGKFLLIKTTRKLQNEDAIDGFSWRLPSLELFHAKTHRDGRIEIFFDDGVLAARGEMYKGRRDSTWKHYYDSGSLMAEGEYKDGLKNGEWLFYSGNGNIKSQGKYVDDLKQGLWREWDRAGTMAEAEFHEGIKKV